MTEKRRESFTGLIGLVVLVAGIYLWVSSWDESPDMVGYFKSDGTTAPHSRVYAFHFEEDVGAEAAEEALRRASYQSEGGLTVAVLFIGDVILPHDHLTLAPSFQEAMDVLLEDFTDYTYRLSLYPTGNEKFTLNEGGS